MRVSQKTHDGAGRPWPRRKRNLCAGPSSETESERRARGSEQQQRSEGRSPVAAALRLSLGASPHCMWQRKLGLRDGQGGQGTWPGLAKASEQAGLPIRLRLLHAR